MNGIRLFVAVSIALGLAPLAVAARFQDVPAAYYASSAIEALAAEGIVQGDDDGFFYPDRTLNRAEAAALLARTLLDPKYVEAFAMSSSFEDVPSGAWFTGPIEALRQSAAIQGLPRTHFEPWRGVNRAEFLKMLFVLDRQNTAQVGTGAVALVNDVPQSAWFYPVMALALEKQIIAPDAFGNVRAGEELSRAETARIIHAYRLSK